MKQHSYATDSEALRAFSKEYVPAMKEKIILEATGDFLYAKFIAPYLDDMLECLEMHIEDLIEAEEYDTGDADDE